MDNNDITGRRFGYTTAIKKVGSNDGAIWECLCDCGNLFTRKAASLRRGVVRGFQPCCGCDIGNLYRVLDGCKICSRCKMVKPVVAFAQARDKSCGYQTYCRQCTSRWRSLNAEYLKRTKKEYAAVNRDKILQRMKAYSKANSSRITVKTCEWAKKNPEKRKKIANNWVKRHPEYNRHQTNLRRANKLRATPSWANLEAIKRLYRKAQGQGLTVDHVVPLVSKIVCGLHCEANLQLLTIEDNMRKGNRYWPDMP